VRQIVLLRGINLGPRNRVAMPQLRKLLEAAGFDDVRTYVQSGNIVLSTRRQPASTAAACEKLIEAELGLDIPVVVRTRDELAEVAAIRIDHEDRRLAHPVARRPDDLPLEDQLGAVR